MTNKRVQIDFQIDDNAAIETGDKLRVQINKNFRPLNYDDGSTIIDKEFIKPVVADANNVIRFTSENKWVNNIGDFVGGVVRTLEVIEIGGQEKYAVGGIFSTYTPDGGSATAVNNFVILNEDGTIYYNNTNLISTSASNSVVRVIKYHEENNSLFIGGRFTGIENYPNINHMFEFDLSTEAPSSNMTQWENGGSIDENLGYSVNDIAIRQSTGNIYFTGTFTQVYNVDRETIGMIRSNFSFPNSSTLDFNKRLEDFITGTGTSVEVNQNGTPYIFIGGTIVFDNPKFPERNFNGLGVLNVFGVVTTNIILPQIIGSNLKTATDSDNNIYVYGTISNFNGSSDELVIKLLPDGTLDENFSTQGEGGTNALAVDDSFVYILAEYSQSQFLFSKLNKETGNVITTYKVDGAANGISLLDNNDIIITNISGYQAELGDLTENQVVVGNTKAETLDNLIDSLNNTSLIEEFADTYYYIISPDNTDAVQLDIIITDDSDVYYLSSIEDRPSVYEVIEVRNDGAFIPQISVAPIRRNVSIEGISNQNTSSFNFEIGELQALINNLGGVVSITKQRVSENINNNYLNISRLIPSDTLRPNLEYFLDMGRGLGVKNSNHGKFYSAEIRGKNNDVVINDTRELLYCLDGFNFESGKAEDKVLLKGSKRLLPRDAKIAIPFLSYQVESIDIASQDINQTITSGSFNLTDPVNSNEFVSYLTLNTGIPFVNSKKIDITFNLDSDFLNAGEPTTTTITIDIDDTCTEYSDKRVIFKNSYGMLEEIFFIGADSNSVETDSEEYEKSVYSYRGSGTKYGHLKTTYNKTGTRMWTLNTGNTREYMNPAFEDMVNSEEVWIEINGEIIPVVCEENSFNNNTEYRDGVLNYTFDFMEAKDLTQKIEQ